MDEPWNKPAKEGQNTARFHLQEESKTAQHREAESRMVAPGAEGRGNGYKISVIQVDLSSWGLLDPIVPTDNNTVSCIENFAKHIPC